MYGIPMSARQASVERNTNETRIKVSVNLDGSGKFTIKSGLPFLEHMLEQVARHGLIDMDIVAEGDLHIDAPASVEGHVLAGEITVNGTLQGNIESARHVELKQGSTVTGDIKAGTLSVTAGARMRGNVEFGFTDGK